METVISLSRNDLVKSRPKRVGLYRIYSIKAQDRVCLLLIYCQRACSPPVRVIWLKDPWLIRGQQLR